MYNNMPYYYIIIIVVIITIIIIQGVSHFRAAEGAGGALCAPLPLARARASGE